MIHKISANNSTFRTVEFTSGLNVILAERHDEFSQDTGRRSCNGLGKTTLINIIDFCLGASHTDNEPCHLYNNEIEGWSFTLEITIEGNRISVTRGFDDSTRVYIKGTTDGFIIKPNEDSNTGNFYYGIDSWKLLLGWSFFGLTNEVDEKYHPTYRSLISYIIRKPTSFISPFTYFQSQKGWLKQVCNTFFLGLNWRLATKWQHLKDQQMLLNSIAKGIREGTWEEISGSIGELEAEKIQLQSKIQQDKSALDDFNVLPQYRELQEEANQIVRKIQEISNSININKRKLTLYEESVQQEVPPDREELECIYNQVGITFPDQIKVTLSKAQEFYDQLISNRRDFLNAEIEKLKYEIQASDERVKSMSKRKSDLLKILQAHGALDEYTKLQKAYLKTEKKLIDVVAQLDKAREVKSKQRDIRHQKSQTENDATLDYDEKRYIWERAIEVFNEYSKILYERPGRLIIDITNDGYKFDVKIERSQSTGIEKMKIFCYDLMLAQISKKRPDFLIHDSSIYDGVDSRQRAKALELAAEKSEQNSFQYICMLNSDAVPWDDFTETFNINKYVKMILKDDKPENSLLGKWY